MMFWDASAVIPLCLKEPHSALVKRIAEKDPSLVAWWSTPIECFSAIARMRREGILADEGERRARQIVSSMAAEWTEMQPGNRIREGAARALLLHPLRAADSLQLAAALVWANDRPTGHRFVCLDSRLREAANREGFTVLPEKI